jgi:hypothetical protein
MDPSTHSDAEELSYNWVQTIVSFQNTRKIKSTRHPSPWLRWHQPTKGWRGDKRKEENKKKKERNSAFKVRMAPSDLLSALHGKKKMN